MWGAIWAQSIDGVIGDGHSMPWYLPEDLARFRQLTTGSPVIMGRRTWESLPPRFRPLPGRDNLVVSHRAPGEWSRGAQVAARIPAPGDAWVIGGGQLYAETLDKVDVLEVTLIDAYLLPQLRQSAVLAPRIPGEAFSLVAESDWLESDQGRLTVGISPLPLRYQFLTYERKASA